MNSFIWIVLLFEVGYHEINYVGMSFSYWISGEFKRTSLTRVSDVITFENLSLLKENILCNLKMKKLFFKKLKLTHYQACR